MPSHNPQDWDWAPREIDPRELFRPPIVSTEFSAAYDSVMERLAKARAEAENKLTREQFIEAITQAIACGDFMQHITMGQATLTGGVFNYSHKQAITYEPYRESERLKTRIRELEAELAREQDAALDSDHL